MYTHVATRSTDGWVLKNIKRKERTKRNPNVTLKVVMLLKFENLETKSQMSASINNRISDPQSGVGGMKNTSPMKPAKKTVNNNSLSSIGI